jgi:hypothetical protein
MCQLLHICLSASGGLVFEIGGLAIAFVAADCYQEEGIKLRGEIFYAFGDFGMGDRHLLKGTFSLSLLCAFENPLPRSICARIQGISWNFVRMLS